MLLASRHEFGRFIARELSLSRRVLVTGGAGFLGSHLCERLVGEGHTVICVDNLSTGRINNIEALFDEPNFTFVNYDVVDHLNFAIDEIYNLACPASPATYAIDPIHTTKTSVLGALNLLQLATTRKVKILQASTSEVYGDPLVSPQAEGYWGNVDPTGPRACYDEGKRCAESLFFDYQRCFSTRIKVARIFNTYGPRMRPDDGRVVSNLIVAALLGRDMTVYGDGNQTRSLCYVNDTIDGLVRLMATSDSTCGPVNIGNPDERTINDYAVLIRELTRSDSRIAYLALPQDDPRRRRPEISEAMRLLGWAPTVPLVDGLLRTIAYFRSELKSESMPQEAST